MASLFPGRTASQSHVQNYARRMSSHLAAALFIFALSQIFVVAKLDGSLAMHFGIIAGVAGFAVAARGMERRWVRRATSALPVADLAKRFRIDLLRVWGATLLAPLLWIPVDMVVHSAFG